MSGLQVMMRQFDERSRISGDCGPAQFEAVPRMFCVLDG